MMDSHWFTGAPYYHPELHAEWGVDNGE